MSPPAYHLRPNKAADRFAFLEAINRLGRISNDGLQEYTYHGLGGPYLEDFRLLYEFCPEIHMVSFEINEEIYNRQQFHRPSRKMKLENENITSYIDRYNPGASKSIFWLDYTDLKYEHFLDFIALLGTVNVLSMIKITLRADPRDYWNLHDPLRPKQSKINDFQNQFGDILPLPDVTPPNMSGDLAELLQQMVRMASEDAFPPSATNMLYLPVSSFYYSDGSNMFTITGIVCDEDNQNDINDAFADWEFSNLSWDLPRRIALPVLSTAERLYLQQFLPMKPSVGKRLRRKLGYLIEDSVEETDSALEQYAAFHRYSPYFIRGTP